MVRFLAFTHVILIILVMNGCSLISQDSGVVIQTTEENVFNEDERVSVTLSQTGTAPTPEKILISVVPRRRFTTLVPVRRVTKRRKVHKWWYVAPLFTGAVLGGLGALYCSTNRLDDEAAMMESRGCALSDKAPLAIGGIVTLHYAVILIDYFNTPEFEEERTRLSRVDKCEECTLKGLEVFFQYQGKVISLGRLNAGGRLEIRPRTIRARMPDVFNSDFEVAHVFNTFNVQDIIRIDWRNCQWVGVSISSCSRSY